MHGHGLRDRQLRGPLEPGGRPRLVVLMVRRYLCLQCLRVVTVVPRGMLWRRLFSAGAIALAMALFGIEELTAAAVRERISPWQEVGATSAKGWLSLRRWVRAVRRGALFPLVARLPDSWTVRQVAARAAAVVSGRAPMLLRQADPVAAAFAGAGLAG